MERNWEQPHNKRPHPWHGRLHKQGPLCWMENNVLVYKLPIQVTPWPKEVDKHSSLRSVGQHLLLKAVSAAIITPFYSASLVETVQSDIASEKPGVLDVFRDGIVRLVSWSDPR